MNKFIGVYKTETEYDWRECLILTYAIPLDSNYTEFDYENTLIVDLRSMSDSIAEFLRDLANSPDALSYRTFMEFAATRNFRGKNHDVINELYSMGVIRKVPSNTVRMRFKDQVRGDFTQGVDEINAFIKAELDQQEEAKNEELPLTERVVRDTKVHGNPKVDVSALGDNFSGATPTSSEVESLPEAAPEKTSDANQALLEAVQQLTERVESLSGEVAELKSKKTRKPRTTTKKTSESGDDSPVE